MKRDTKKKENQNDIKGHKAVLYARRPWVNFQSVGGKKEHWIPLCLLQIWLQG